MYKKGDKNKDFDNDLIEDELNEYENYEEKYEAFNADYKPLNDPNAIFLRENEINEDEKSDPYNLIKKVKKPKKVKPVEKINGAELLDRCEFHKDKFLDYVCLDIICEKIYYCEKCKGEHNNHKCINYTKIKEILNEYKKLTEQNISKVSEILAKIELIKNEVISKLNELEKTVKEIYKFTSSHIQENIENSGKKSMTLLNLYEKMIQKMHKNIDLWKSNANLVSKFSQRKEAMEYYYKNMNRIKAGFNNNEAFLLEKITSFILQITDFYENYRNDFSDISEIDEEIYLPFVLENFNKMDQIFKNLTTEFFKYLGLAKMRVYPPSFLVNFSTSTIYYSDISAKKPYPKPRKYNPNLVESNEHFYIVVVDNLYISGRIPEKMRNFHYMINLRSFEMSRKAPMKKLRDYYTLVSLRNKYICALGGYTKEPLYSCEYYSIDNDEWFLMNPLIKPLENPVATVFQDRFIYVFDQKDYKSRSVDIQYYDFCDPEKGWILNISLAKNIDFLRDSFIANLSPNYIHIFRKQDQESYEEFLLAPYNQKKRKSKRELTIALPKFSLRNLYDSGVYNGKLFLLFEEKLVAFPISSFKQI